jgi:surfeit locus 1 family protein
LTVTRLSLSQHEDASTRQGDEDADQQKDDENFHANDYFTRPASAPQPIWGQDLMRQTTQGTLASRGFIWLMAILVMALTARLGIWQLDRAQEKTRLQTQILERVQQAEWPQRQLAASSSDLPGQLHRRTQVTGQWLDRWTVFLDNRQLDGRPGFFVLTPLRLSDGTAVVVQRGWLPRHFLEREQVQAPVLPEGEVQLLARIAAPPSRLLALGEEGDSKGRIRQNLDLEAYALETGLNLRPLSLLQLDGSAQTNDGLRRDWPLPALDVSKHHGYAFQWFALSLVTLALTVWFQIIQPRRRHGRPQSQPPQ